ncbi:MAG TPA: acyltransferase [Acidobacteriota bacterium]|nr:acyltransferase [Acidobacteriota bacterium]
MAKRRKVDRKSSTSAVSSGKKSGTAAVQRIVEFESLRGLSALGVILYHYTGRYHHFFQHRDRLWYYQNYHTFWNPMFFMISGYLIYLILQKKVKRPLDFIYSRFSRLYPTYWFCLIITFLVVRWAQLPLRQVATTDFCWNFLMFQEVLGNANFVDGAYWTLTLEMVFYAFMLVLFTVRQLHRVEFLVLAWVLMPLFFFQFGLPGFINDSHTWRSILMIGYSHYFGAGIMIYRLRNDRVTVFRLLLLACCLAVPLVTIPYPENWISFLGMVLFILAALQVLPPLRAKFLLFFGSISYPLYLLHQNVGYAIIRCLNQVLRINSNVAILAAFAIVVLGATAVTRLVEQPSLRFLRKLYSQNLRPL